jgi:CubicO group peptidase (beta-lactamase class C family)
MKNKKILLSTKVFLLLILVGWFYIPAYGERANYWPTDGWRTSTPEQQGINSDLLADMLAAIIEKKYNIDSVMVIRNGYMVLDAYFYPYQKGEKHILRSCTKSITSALVGIAIDKGYIKSVEQQILSIFPEITPANLDKDKRAIKLKHLLTMSSGLKAEDSYLYQWRGLFKMMRSQDWTQYMLDLPMAEPPGTRFDYSNGVSYLLSAIIQKTTGMRSLEFAKKHLFAPLGITDVMWRTNPKGVDLGYDGIWLTPHDMAKFGWLFLNKGNWEGKQVIFSAWVEESTRQQIQLGNTSVGSLGYGYQWWYLGDKGVYLAMGRSGQRIYVLPERNMVIVVTAVLPDFQTTQTLLSLSRAYGEPAIESEVALPANSKAKARLDNLLKSIQKAPKPVPVPDLPDMARLISGRKYRREKNPYGLGDFTFVFGTKKDEALYEFEIWGVSFSASVGLDNVYRFTNSKIGKIAIKGLWSAEDTITLYYHIVGGTGRGQAQFKFDGDNVNYQQDDIVWGSRSLKGRLKKSSN